LKLKKLVLTSCLSFFLILGATRQQLAGDEVSRIIDGMRGRYGNAAGITADYTREAISKTMALLGTADRQDIAQGTLYFRPPYSLRLEQKSPQEELLVTDGQSLWWYVPHKNEAYRYPALEFGRELRLLSDILRGLRDAEANFEITLNAHSDTNIFALTFKPDPPWPDIDHLQVMILKNDYTIKQVAIYNMVGGLTRFVFTGLQESDGFEEAFFSFSPPHGTKVIDQ
jgi:outer membrane lipoprotein carrier protein